MTGNGPGGTRPPTLTADETVDLYLKEFTSLKAGEFSGDPPPFLHLRQAAMDRFSELGFPTPAMESWRHTDISSLSRTPYRPLTPGKRRIDRRRLDPYVIADVYRAVVVNGRFDSSLSLLPPEGVEIGSLRDAMGRNLVRLPSYLGGVADIHNHPFVALNTAFMTDGLFIHVPQNTVVDRPIHAVIFTDPPGHGRMSHVRHLIRVEANSEATVVEHYLGGSSRDYWMNCVTENVVEENATLRHIRVVEDSPEAYHVATAHTLQFAQSTLEGWSVVVGGKLVRNDTVSRLDAEGCGCTLKGLVLARGRQHVDNHTFVSHEKPHGTSHQLYKGIYGGRSHGVFNGRIFVRQDAQKTNADQTNRNLLISRDALVNSNPQLEINADDVRCTHGSTTGQLDEEVLFYLHSRGLDDVSARTLLAAGFAGEVTGGIPHEPLRDYLSRLLSDWLSGISWEEAE